MKLKSPFETILDLAKGIAKTGKSAVTGILNTDIGKITGNERANMTITGIAANTILGLPKATLETARDITQTVGRTAISTGVAGYNAFAPKEKFVSEVPSPFFLGKEPIKGLSTKASDLEQSIRNSPTAQKYGLSGKASLPIAFGGTVGGAFIDLFPGTSGKGKLVKQLVEETSEQTIKLLLKRNVKNLTDDAIEKIAPVIAKSKDATFIEKTLGEVVIPKKTESFNDLHVDDQKFLTKYADDVKVEKGVALRDTEIVKETFKQYGLAVPENPKQIASQITLMKQGAENASGEAFMKSIGEKARAITKEGKPAVTQPRDTVGRFDYKKKVNAPSPTAVPTKTEKRIISDIIPFKGNQSINKIGEAKNILRTIESSHPNKAIRNKANSARAYLERANSASVAESIVEGFSNEFKESQGKGIVERAKDYFKSIPNKQGGFADFGSGAPSAVDRLIAEGKIRVKRVGNRDVYEYRKGSLWQRARDEDSAVKAVTQIREAKKLSQILEDRKTVIEIKKEALANNPLNSLTKYVAKRGDSKGSLPEVLGGKDGKFKKSGDDIITEKMGQNTDSETVREQMDDFLAQKRKLAEEEQILKEDIKKSKSEIPAKVSPKEEVKRPSSPIQEVTGGTGEVRSLEKLAEQSAREEIHDPQLRKSFSLPNIIEKIPTPVKAKVNMLDYIRTPENVLKKIGLQKQGEELRRGYDAYLKELPQNLEKITKWSEQVPKESNKRIFQYLDGQNIDLTATEEKVAGEIKVWLSEWADRLGLPKDNRIATYITHIFDDQLIKKEFDEDLAKIIAGKIPGSVYDPFLLKRLGANGYKEDVWAALDAYVKRGTRKVHMDKPLANLEEVSSRLEESQWNYVKRYADRINLRPTELDNIVDNGIKSVIGYRAGQRPVATISRALRQATYRGMLGLNVGSALRNLSQGINTYAKLGEKYTAVGYSKLFSRANLAELKAEGVLSSSFVQDRSISAVKKTMQKVDKALFYMFETAEKINRGAAYFGAKSKGLASGMTEAKAIEYAKKIVRETQFQFGSIDTPVGMSSDLVKTLTQFQTFTTKQIEFIAGMAKNKEYAGLVRYTLSGLAFVYTIGQAFGMKPQDLIPIYRLGVPPSLKLPFEVASAVVGAPDEYGQPRSAGKKAEDIANTLPGYIPAGIQAKKTIQGVNAIREGGSYDKSGKLQFPQGQSKAALLQSVLFGKYASQNAKDYFAGETTNVKEKAKVQPVYDEVQKLLEEGNEADALALHNSLSESDKVTYKAIKSSVTASNTLQGKKDILPVYNQVQNLIKEGKEEEALGIHSSLSADEKKYYKLVKADKLKLESAKAGDKPSFNPNEVQSDSGVVETVWTYAKALGVDPVTAFNRIFTGQRIKYVSNGTVVVERLPLAESQAEKKAQGSTGSEVKLDHTVPLQLGGSNEKGNLKLVPTEIWATYTPVENALGEALRAGKIEKEDAQRLINNFKNGEMTSDEIYSIINS